MYNILPPRDTCIRDSCDSSKILNPMRPSLPFVKAYSFGITDPSSHWVQSQLVSYHPSIEESQILILDLPHPYEAHVPVSTLNVWTTSHRNLNMHKIWAPSVLACVR